MNSVGRCNSGVLRRGPFKVIVSFIALVAFLFNMIGQDFILLRPLGFVGQAWAAPTPLEPSPDGSNRSGDPGFIKELNAATFSLPEYLGHIKDSWSPVIHSRSAPLRVRYGYGGYGGYGNSESLSPVVIHIQDAHCNYAAQHKIAEIIEYLNKEYGIDTINLEGGAKDYDLSPFTKISDKAIREKTADYFVKEGLVNGAEYYAINNPEKVTLWGIEDTKLYIDNLNIYRESLKTKDEIDRHLKMLEHILNNLKSKIFSKELLELDTKYSHYKAGVLEFKDYLGYLIQAAKQKAIDIKLFTNIYLLSQTLEEEESINFKRANNQKDELIDRLQKKLSRKMLEELVVKTIDFRSEKISQKDFYGYLADKAKYAGIDLKDFPELERYIVYITMYNAIDKTKIMEEMESLENKIKGELYQNEKQKALNILSKNLAVLKNIFNISLTKEDYKYYLDNEEAFSAANYTSFINREAPLYNIIARPDETIANLDRYREKISKFYEYSFKRDDVFVKNMSFESRCTPQPSSRAEQGNPSSSLRGAKRRSNLKNAAILITGGFHTENLCDMFKKENIAYISIVPNFRNYDGYECPYFNLLAGRCDSQVKTYIQTILGSTLALASPFTKLGDEVSRETGDVNPGIILQLEIEWTTAKLNGKGLVIKHGDKILGAISAARKYIKSDEWSDGKSDEFVEAKATQFATSSQLPAPEKSVAVVLPKPNVALATTTSVPAIENDNKVIQKSSIISKIRNIALPVILASILGLAVYSLYFIMTYKYQPETSIVYTAEGPSSEGPSLAEVLILKRIRGAATEKMTININDAAIEILYQPSTNLIDVDLEYLKQYLRNLPKWHTSGINRLYILSDDFLQSLQSIIGTNAPPGGFYFDDMGIMGKHIITISEKMLLGLQTVDWFLKGTINGFDHEIGHYVYHNKLTDEQKRLWGALYQKSDKKRRSLDYISDNGMTNNAEEEFADAYSFYCSNSAALMRRACEADSMSILAQKVLFVAKLFIETNKSGESEIICYSPREFDGKPAHWYRDFEPDSIASGSKIDAHLLNIFRKHPQLRTLTPPYDVTQTKVPLSPNVSDMSLRYLLDAIGRNSARPSAIPHVLLPESGPASPGAVSRVSPAVKPTRFSTSRTGIVLTQCVTGDTILPVISDIKNCGLKVELRPIIEVRPGDYVLSLNEETQKIEPHRINGLLDMGIKPVYKLTTASGRFIKTTANHPYLTERGWVKVYGLKAGNEIAVERENNLSHYLLARKSFSSRTNNLLLKSEDKWNFKSNFLSASTSFAAEGGWTLIRIIPFGILREGDIFFAFNHLSGKMQGGFNMRLSKRRVATDNLFRPFSGLKELKDKIYHYTGSFKAWLAMTDIGVGSYIFFNSHINASLRHLVYHAFIGMSKCIFLETAEAAEVIERPIHSGDILWDRIVSIERLGLEHVYDIEVEGTHNFIGNGIVAHNTYISAPMPEAVSSVAVSAADIAPAVVGPFRRSASGEAKLALRGRTLEDLINANKDIYADTEIAEDIRIAHFFVLLSELSSFEPIKHRLGELRFEDVTAELLETNNKRVGEFLSDLITRSGIPQSIKTVSKAYKSRVIDQFSAEDEVKLFRKGVMGRTNTLREMLRTEPFTTLTAPEQERLAFTIDELSGGFEDLTIVDVTNALNALPFVTTFISCSAVPDDHGRGEFTKLEGVAFYRPHTGLIGLKGNVQDPRFDLFVDQVVPSVDGVTVKKPLEDPFQVKKGIYDIVIEVPPDLVRETIGRLGQEDGLKKYNDYLKNKWQELLGAVSDLTVYSGIGRRSASGEIERTVEDGMTLAEFKVNYAEPLSKADNWGLNEVLSAMETSTAPILSQNLFDGQPAAIAIGVTNKEWGLHRNKLAMEKSEAMDAIEHYKLGNISLIFFEDSEEGRKSLQSKLGALNVSQDHAITFTRARADTGLTDSDKKLKELTYPIFMKTYEQANVSEDATPVFKCIRTAFAALNLLEQEDNKRVSDKTDAIREFTNSIISLSDGAFEQDAIKDLAKDIQEKGLKNIILLISIRPVNVNELQDYHTSMVQVMRSL